MTVTKKLIENINEVRKTLNEISVYDLEVYTAIELYYHLAEKINEIIKELYRYEGVLLDEIIIQNEKLQYLLNEGLNIEVVKKINEMLLDGTLADIINITVFEDLNNLIAEKVFKFNNVGEMKNYKLKVGDVVKTQGYFTKDDGGHGDYIIIEDSEIECNEGSYIKLNNGLVAKLKTDVINVKQFGIFSDEVNAQTEKIRLLFKNKGKIYFPKGTYILDNYVFVYDDTYVECDSESIFKLKDNSNVKMFINDFNQNNFGKDIYAEYNDFSWVGGRFDLNGENQVLPDWNNLSGAFLLTRFNVVTLKNIYFNDSYGHTINHFGNNTLICSNLTFNNKVRINKQGNKNGGSRSDGITGASKNMYISDIKGFTDDDMVALVSGLDWGFGKSKIETCNIKNVYCKMDDELTWGVWNVLGIYTHKDYPIDTVTLENVKGDINFSFLKTGGGHINNFTLNNIDVSKKSADNFYKTLIQLYEDTQIKNMVVNSFKFENMNVSEEYFIELSSIGLKEITKYSKVENMTLNDIIINHNITTPVPNKYSMIKLTNDVYINNLKGNVVINSNKPSDYSFIRDASVTVDKQRVNLADKKTFIEFELTTENIANNVMNLYRFDNLHSKYCVVSESLKTDTNALAEDEHSKIKTRYCNLTKVYKPISYAVQSVKFSNFDHKEVKTNDENIVVCIKCNNTSQNLSYNDKLISLIPTNIDILKYVPFNEMFVPVCWNNGLSKVKIVKTSNSIDLIAGEGLEGVTYMYFMFTIPLL